ncbi:Nucleotidyltransferase [Thioalkalivibrio nitratireducens DSM 14787]|uniref:Nucleotidyltransferase n=1 Tax=Thioalkalivibrio nitratireducens (strain DSM 14787 / UNIQEM 213 / ALEN2) TaxID=1255043 RepID=L0DWF4_THIND|nr:nucleotidyltransferase substrate binding protein [Thioalkalivibrio nitratireducens]AGA33347.1 Nucleotidyltransferase [Thioalkalivibrio nitratireducens DSM 14787]
MPDPDVRWRQRLANYRRALAQLNAAVDLAQSRELSDLERHGLIQAFEFTHELAWNVMKDYFAYQGNPAITGSRDAVREVFSRGLIEDGEGWMEMIQSRNQTTHTYNDKVAAAIASRIRGRYRPLFQQFLERMEALDPDAS